MRFLIYLLALLVAAAVIAGALTYPAWLLVNQFAEYRADRVMHRLWELLIFLGVWWLLKREGVSNRSMFGYGVPKEVFLRQMVGGFVAGVLLMLPLVLGLMWADVRMWNAQPDVSIAITVLYGAIAGFAVAFVEESIARGAVFSALERESGALAATFVTSLLFAVAHFLRGHLRIPSDEMDFLSGLRLVADIFADYESPLRIIDAILALFALGVLLSLIRLRTGAIAGSIGLHAGGVAVIAVVSKVTLSNPSSQPDWLIPSYNYVVGYLAFIWISIVAVAYWLRSRDRLNRVQLTAENVA